MSLFETTVAEAHPCAIVMIDNSGSTSDSYHTQYIEDKIKNLKEKYSKDAIKTDNHWGYYGEYNVLRGEFCSVHQLLKNQGIKECNLMVWNSSVHSTDKQISLSQWI